MLFELDVIKKTISSLKKEVSSPCPDVLSLLWHKNKNKKRVSGYQLLLYSTIISVKDLKNILHYATSVPLNASPPPL